MQLSPYHYASSSKGTVGWSQAAEPLLSQLPLRFLEDQQQHSFPFAYLVDALQTLEQNRFNKPLQHEILQQLFHQTLTFSDKPVLDVYLLLRMLLPSLDNECVYGIKTKRLLRLVGNALSKLGKPDSNAVIKQWLLQVPLQQKEEGGIVCLPELVVAMHCGNRGTTQQGGAVVGLRDIAALCQNLTTAYLTQSTLHVPGIDTVQREILLQVMEKGGFTFQEWLVLARLLLKKVSMGVGPQTVFDALPDGAATAFGKQRDLACLAQAVVTSWTTEASMDALVKIKCGVPFVPMTCNTLRSPYLMQWLFAREDLLSKPIRPKEGRLVILHHVWYVPVNSQKARTRFVRLDSDDCLAVAGRRKHMLLLREFQRGGLLNENKAEGGVLHYTLSAEPSHVYLLLLRAVTSLWEYGAEFVDSKIIIPTTTEPASLSEEYILRVENSKLRVEVVQRPKTTTPRAPPPPTASKNSKTKSGATVTLSHILKKEEEQNKILAQLKLDGDRLQVHADEAMSVRLFTKWGKDVTELYSCVQEDLVPLLSGHVPCVLDGELIVVDSVTDKPLPWSSTKWRYNDTAHDKTVSELRMQKDPAHDTLTFVYNNNDVIGHDETEDHSLVFGSRKGLARWGGMGQAEAEELKGRALTGAKLRLVFFDILMHQGRPVHHWGCRARFDFLKRHLQTLLVQRSVYSRVLEEGYFISTVDELLSLLRQTVEREQEGLVLKDPDAPYDFGKSKRVQKIKLGGPDINTGIIGVGSSLSKNPRMCGLLTCIRNHDGRLQSYCRTEFLRGDKPWKAVEYVMDLPSRVSVAETSPEVHLARYTVFFSQVSAGQREVQWLPRAEEDMQYQCSLLLNASDLVDIQWLVNPYECMLGLSLSGDLRPVVTTLCKPRNPVGRIEIREHQMSQIDSEAGIRAKYDEAQTVQTCIERHTLARIRAMRALPPTRAGLEDIRKILSVVVNLKAAVWPSMPPPSATLDGFNTLLEQARALIIVQSSSSVLGPLTPEERQVFSGLPSFSQWIFLDQKQLKQAQKHKRESVEDAVLNAQKMAEIETLTSRLRQLQNNVLVPVVQCTHSQLPAYIICSDISTEITTTEDDQHSNDMSNNDFSEQEENGTYGEEEETYLSPPSDDEPPYVEEKPAPWQGLGEFSCCGGNIYET